MSTDTPFLSVGVGRGHPSSCPCPDCNDYDPAREWERDEERYSPRGEEPPDSRAQTPDKA